MARRAKLTSVFAAACGLGLMLSACSLAGPTPHTFTPAAEQALIHAIENGKGFVIYHFSLAAFDGWQAFEELSGGNWRPNNGHHSPPHDFAVTITDQDHPITAGLRAKLPQPVDELYANLKWQPDRSRLARWLRKTT